MSFTQFMSLFRVMPPGSSRKSGRRDEHPGRKRPRSRGEPRVTPPRTYQASAPDSTTDDARANERILSRDVRTVPTVRYEPTRRTSRRSKAKSVVCAALASRRLLLALLGVLRLPLALLDLAERGVAGRGTNLGLLGALLLDHLQGRADERAVVGLHAALLAASNLSRLVLSREESVEGEKARSARVRGVDAVGWGERSGGGDWRAPGSLRGSLRFGRATEKRDDDVAVDAGGETRPVGRAGSRNARGSASGARGGGQPIMAASRILCRCARFARACARSASRGPRVRPRASRQKP